MQQITVEVFAEEEAEWWWGARQLRLRRGPFADQGEADSDAVVHPDLLIATLCSTVNAG
jgi:hypothetical protein